MTPIADRHAFVLGMCAAFCECVAWEAKPLAFSPPIDRQTSIELAAQVQRLADDMGVQLYLEQNADLDTDLLWWVFYKFDSERERYLSLRRDGHNPWRELTPFHPLLGYGTVYGEGAEQVRPRLRQPVNPMAVVSELLGLDG